MGNIVEIPSTENLTSSLESGSVHQLQTDDTKGFDINDFDNTSLDNVIIVTPLEHRTDSGHMNLAFEDDKGSVIHYRPRSKKSELQEDSIKISDWSDTEY